MILCIFYSLFVWFMGDYGYCIVIVVGDMLMFVIFVGYIGNDNIIKNK